MVGQPGAGIGYTIDAAGNRTADNKTTWVINARGRVSQIRVIDGAITNTYNYLINGLNQRVRKTGPSSVVPQGTQVFVYDEAGRLVGEYDNLGRARSEHVWLADRPVALIVYAYAGSSTTPASTTLYSVEADHLGTPRLITDATQARRWFWHSAPYGDTMPDEKPGIAPALVYNLRFAGQYFDKETSTYHNWHRDYDPITGRYLQSDPIGLEGGINTYAYVSGKPLTSVDATGQGVGSFLVCSALNASYQVYKVHSALRELKSNTECIERQLARVSQELSDCLSSDVDRMNALKQMQSELMGRLTVATQDTVISENRIGLGDAGEAAAWEGVCGLLRFVPGF